MTDLDLDTRVRVRVMERFVADGHPPSALDLAGDLRVSSSQVEDALHRLHDAHALVLAPGTSSVWMANPLSALPTRFTVDVGERTYWGNCIWDGLGVVSMLGGTGAVRTACADCDERMTVDVDAGRPGAEDGAVVHFLLPARRWWDAIGFT